MSQQDYLHDAFTSLLELYQESAVLLADAGKMFDHAGLPGQQLIHAYAKTLREGPDWPFIYLAGRLFTPAEPGPGLQRTAFLAISFHDPTRRGPHLLGGVIEAAPGTEHTVWLVNATARRPGHEGYFTVTADGPLQVHTPANPVQNPFGQVARVIHGEVALTAIDKPARLEALVHALARLMAGDEAPLRVLLGSYPAVVPSIRPEENLE
jgi:hypothetical protein